MKFVLPSLLVAAMSLAGCAAPPPPAQLSGFSCPRDGTIVRFASGLTHRYRGPAPDDAFYCLRQTNNRRIDRVAGFHMAGDEDLDLGKVARRSIPQLFPLRVGSTVDYAGTTQSDGRLGGLTRTVITVDAEGTYQIGGQDRPVWFITCRRNSVWGAGFGWTDKYVLDKATGVLLSFESINTNNTGTSVPETKAISLTEPPT